MKCSKCGFVLPDDSEFCQYCGVKLRQDVPSVDSIDTAVATPVPEPLAEQSEPLDVSADTVAEPVVVEEVQEPIDASEELAAPVVVANTPSPDDSDANVQVEPNIVSAPAVVPEEPPNAAPHPKKAQYCKRCGGFIDVQTKKCSKCGKQYFKSRTLPFVIVPTVLIVALTYFGTNYFCAVSAMNNQEFIKAKQFFDNTFFARQLFSAKYDYIKAGVLMEEGEYVSAYNAFLKIKGTPVPVSVTDTLKDKIYAEGQAAYRADDRDTAKRCFYNIASYKRSKDYILLLNCKGTKSGKLQLVQTSEYDNLFNNLSNLLGFEDTDEIILNSSYALERFLLGRWEDGKAYPRYFELTETDNDGLYSYYNLPHKNIKGSFTLSKGIYTIDGTKTFRFEIVDEDTIKVYCYKNGTTVTLYRQ